MAKTPCSQRRGPGLSPRSGNWIPHAVTKDLHATTETWCGQIINKINSKKKKKPYPQFQGRNSSRCWWSGTRWGFVLGKEEECFTIILLLQELQCEVQKTKEAFLQNSTLLDRLPQPAEPNTHVLLSGQMHSLQRASYLETMLLVKTNEFEVLLIFSIQVIVLDTCTLRTVPSILWSDSYQCFVGCTLGKQQNKDTLNISTIWHDSAVMWFFSHISSLLNMLKWYSLYTVQITQYLNLQVG